jgi:hypothetical protein
MADPALYRQARDEARRLAPQRYPHLFDPGLIERQTPTVWLDTSEDAEPVQPVKRTRKVPDTVAPGTMLRLDVAAELAFPDGSVSVAALRREAAAGHLTIYAIAGKHFTTLTNIQEMKTKCRVPVRAPDCGSDQPAKTEPKSTSSSMEARKQAQAAAKATLLVRNVSSKPISNPSTTRGRGAEVIRMPSK